MSDRRLTLVFEDSDTHQRGNVDEPTTDLDQVLNRLTDRVTDMYNHGWVLSAASDEGALFAYEPEAKPRVRRRRDD